MKVIGRRELDHCQVNIFGKLGKLTLVNGKMIRFMVQAHSQSEMVKLLKETSKMARKFEFTCFKYIQKVYKRKL